MRVKLDENPGTRGLEFFRNYGHQATTVVEQSMQSATDHDVIEACRRERRCIVTLDLDFSNPFVFPPEEYYGIAVLRLSEHEPSSELHCLTERLADYMAKRDITGRLWILRDGRIREYMERESLSYKLESNSAVF